MTSPYSPQQKGHVERVIKTFQHDLGPLLPGFVGHSVADRKAIEDRKSFAQRLGESEAETFGVSLTGLDLQKRIDDWAATIYQHKPHEGLQGVTPFNAALASDRPVRKVDARALDLLLMPVAGQDGQRTVTKLGIRVDGYHYLAATIMVGTAVFVRMDPNDAGRAYAFAHDGAEFLEEVVCPELSGKLADELGFEAAEKLSRRFGPDYISVPLVRELRARHYRSSGMSNADIARKLGLSESAVNRLFQRMANVPVKGSGDPRQLKLFG
ncbi:Mu transposase C-terminal domain-containing protein [Mesorhizobium sp. ES1-4]|uniref:Mu transposase C-terminal domain-containing protein n=1 Tax=Mesorhizobium sp. ES1-4 TaxID=2876627 RepID=UPI001CCEF932|nr:Mu transposase C-terminal domain-containing protein [Mesorhizobium sp. ES1-4]MBZ9794328.1 Mu transposase C-terminal domain-containing protein [Mesorhizobium sp. ES1-4]